MIFVTVGTHEQPFNRLIQKVDELKRDGIIKDDVIIQTGFSTYEPKYCQWSKLIPYQQMIRNVADARIVITHGGPASFIMPLQIGKTPIVVPRQHQFNEHVNDHQVEFARNVAERMGNILVVEDDKQVREGVRDILEANEYTVFEAYNEKTALHHLSTVPIQTIILDIQLGEENGFDLCRKIRAKSNVPILFLTALTGEMELVRGFSIGGDDYLTKPFRITELLARANILVRRYDAVQSRPLWNSGDLSFDTNLFQVLKNGALLELTPLEIKLVYALMSVWPSGKSRDQLLYEVWDRQYNFVEENTLNVNISRLREKLGKTEKGDYITTVRGVGYRWNQEVRK